MGRAGAWLGGEGGGFGARFEGGTPLLCVPRKGKMPLLLSNKNEAASQRLSSSLQRSTSALIRWKNSSGAVYGPSLLLARAKVAFKD